MSKPAGSGPDGPGEEPKGPQTGEPQSSAERPGSADGGELTVRGDGADEQAADEQAADEQVADEQAADEQAADEQVADGQVAGRARQGMFGVQGSGDTSGFGGLRLPAYAPAPAERPFGGYFDEVADALAAAMGERDIPGGAVAQITVDRGEITFYVRREHIVEMCRTLRDDPALRFEMLASLSGVDYGPEVPQRLHVVYELLSMTYRRRIRLEVTTDVDDARVPSVVQVYPTADWQERETWDMFGVDFEGHPALTRILMPDDWEGFPQRKDYPLGGIPVEYKGAEIPPPDERRAYS